jgi:spermidine dehydrogenase
MNGRITRRDFLNGTQVAIGASLLSPWSEVFGSPASPFALPPDYYPPQRTGLRGSHDGAWETMHARVGGKSWSVGEPREHYDLIIVGAGISGLSAAHFYRAAHPDARILLLDNHDDFGGHAKRNEFSIDGSTRIGYGGTEAIDTPSAYSEVARRLLADIGIELEKFYDYFHQDLYASLNLTHSIMFDEQTYGERKLVTGYGSRPWSEFAADAPMSDEAACRPRPGVHREERLPARHELRAEVRAAESDQLPRLPARLREGRRAGARHLPAVVPQLLRTRLERRAGTARQRIR